MVDRLEGLERGVEHLKQQVSRLLQLSPASQLLQDLETVCQDLRKVRGSNPAQATEDPRLSLPQTQGTTTHAHSPVERPEDATPSPASHSPSRQSFACPSDPSARGLRVTHVLKEDSDRGYLVTLCYVSPYTPQMASVSPAIDEVLKQPEANMVTVKINKKEEFMGVVQLALDLRVPRHSVSVILRLSSNSAQQLRLPYAQVSVKPRPEVTYTPGSDVKVEFSLGIKDDDHLVRGQDMVMKLTLPSSAEPDLVKKYTMTAFSPHPEIDSVRVDELFSGKDNSTTSVVIPHSAGKAWGIMEYQKTLQLVCEDDCLVYMLGYGRESAFYPRGQEGPFNESYLAFVRQPTSDYSFYQYEDVDCDIRHYPCGLYCEAVGDHPMVTITKAHAPSPGPHLLASQSNVYSGSFTFLFDQVSMDDAGRYVCSATSRVGSDVITRNMTLTVTWQAEILRNYSDVEALDDGSLRAVCTAQGVPAPTLRFGPLWNANDTTILNAGVVAMSKVNDTTSRAVLVIPEWKGFSVRQIEDVFCFAGNDADGDFPVYENIWSEEKNWRTL